MEPVNQKRGKLVLVTGGAGLIGRAVARELNNRGHRVRGFDRVRGDPEADWMIGDLTDAKAVREAVNGVDVVVHLAATPHENTDFLDDLLPNNIVGTYNVFEAVREAGIKRLIVTSSIQVVGGLTGPGKTVVVEDGTAPQNAYAVTKVFAEQMGYAYAHRHDISVIAVRPGWVPRKVPDPEKVYANAYLSPRDAGRFFADCVDSKKVSAPGFEILFALSRCKGRPPFDLAPARKIIGYEPRDIWPEGFEGMPAE